MPTQLHLSTDPAAVAADFTRFFFEPLAGKEHFTVALSGGSTPKLLFQLWASEHRNAVDWSKVRFFWGDERCVPPNHEESNYGMTKSLFFNHIDIPEGNIHRVIGEADPVAEAVRYSAEISDNTEAQLDGYPVFDLVILGMGGDGHTASIFPHQMELLQAEEFCGVATHPESGQKRVSITGNVINRANTVAFLVTGASKQEKVASILGRQGDAVHYPAAHIQPKSGDLHWFLDEAAYGSLV
ncbi:MAG: 6-phosphogluconolactonase [Bacteroidota bacterium]